MNSKPFAFTALFVGIIGIACVCLQIFTYDNHLSAEWDYPASKWNYFAFFTVLTNLAIDIWLILVAISVFGKNQNLYNRLTAPALHGALVLYILTVSLVYCGLLFWFVGPFSTALWWGNIVDMWNHLVMPLFMLFVFWFAAPVKDIKLKSLWLWLIYPFVYFAISLVRGLITGWYPYPFFKPSLIVFPVTIIAIATIFVGIGYATITLHNLKAKKQSAPS